MGLEVSAVETGDVYDEEGIGDCSGEPYVNFLAQNAIILPGGDRGRTLAVEWGRLLRMLSLEPEMTNRMKENTLSSFVLGSWNRVESEMTGF